MFLTVIEARTEEVLVSSDQDTVGESTEPVVEVVELNKIQQIEKNCKFIIVLNNFNGEYRSPC